MKRIILCCTLAVIFWGCNRSGEFKFERIYPLGNGDAYGITCDNKLYYLHFKDAIPVNAK